jgi:hypothetical protein
MTEHPDPARPARVRRDLPVRANTGAASKILTAGVTTSMVLGIVTYIGTSARADAERKAQAARARLASQERAAGAANGPALDDEFQTIEPAVETTDDDGEFSDEEIPDGTYVSTSATTLEVINLTVPTTVPTARPAPNSKRATTVVHRPRSSTKTTKPRTKVTTARQTKTTKPRKQKKTTPATTIKKRKRPTATTVSATTAPTG